MELHADRASSRQRAQVETAKLLATFSSAVATTMVAAMLQVGGARFYLDLISAAVLVVAILLTGLVILVDRITEADIDAVLRESAVQKWTPEQLEKEMAVATVAAVKANDPVVKRVHLCVGFQFAAAAAATGLSILALLIPAATG